MLYTNKMNSFKGDNFTYIRQLFLFSFGYDGISIFVSHYLNNTSTVNLKILKNSEALLLPSLLVGTKYSILSQTS